MSAQYSAEYLAKILGDHAPTEEQRRIIESPMAPALVIAGAGSGKTETMSNRVLYLVANGFVAPHEVLGMTFTRKAAGELRARFRLKLEKLRAAGIVIDQAAERDAFNQPTVSTYNSFASQLFSQYAVLIGRDPDATVLGEAAAWLLARQVAQSATELQLMDIDKSLDAITQAILEFAHALSDNIADPQAVSKYGIKMSKHLEKISKNPTGAKVTQANAKTLESITSAAVGIPAIVGLAQQFAELKRKRGFVEFSDQVSFALEICNSFPFVIEDLRSQYRVILLDEYQDTSVVQARMLSRLFADSAVMAVGDPNQSIYEWRGASADNMGQFHTQYSKKPASVVTYPLTTSWRNPTSVLAGANRLLEKLPPSAGDHVLGLQAREDAVAGTVEVSFESTIIDEAQAVARWFHRNFEDAPKASAAMLCRSMVNVAPFAAALFDAQVPFHIVGIGGLLEQPGVVDIVCGLRVLHEANADSELVRLLTGPVWRLGIKDIYELKKVASWLAARDYRLQKLEKQVTTALRNTVITEESASLIDALDFIAVTKLDHGSLKDISPVGRERLKHAGQLFARLRRSVGTDIREIITIVSQELRIDIEAIANETNAAKNGNIEAFIDLVTPYLTVDARPTLGGFLSWLREAERREKLAPYLGDPEPGVVQIMTIHSAKGLEHDFVAVPRMVQDELPGIPSRAEHWVAFGKLPYPFRGDSAHLPQFAWESASTAQELAARYETFKKEVQAKKLLEDRRLAYVAVTRAKEKILLSGSYWSVQKKYRAPSEFLIDVCQAVALDAPNMAPDDPETHPMGERADTTPWPLDPLGKRRAEVEQARDLVLAAHPGDATEWDRDIDLLLAEHNRRISGADQELALPIRIPASKFKDFIDNPEETAKRLRRPVPEKPYRATNLGTIFHSWVEQRSQGTHLVELIDARAEELDGDQTDVLLGIDEQQLEALKRTFEASKWGNRQPIEVEREINLPFGPHYIVCKIDAVYDVPGQPGRVEIVDWKTGKAPNDAHDAELKQTQLALYKLAYSKAMNIAPENIDVAFYFVAEDTVLTPEKVYSEAELLEAWSSVTGSKP